MYDSVNTVPLVRTFSHACFGWMHFATAWCGLPCAQCRWTLSQINCTAEDKNLSRCIRWFHAVASLLFFFFVSVNLLKSHISIRELWKRATCKIRSRFAVTCHSWSRDSLRYLRVMHLQRYKLHLSKNTFLQVDFQNLNYVMSNNQYSFPKIINIIVFHLNVWIYNTIEFNYRFLNINKKY